MSENSDSDDDERLNQLDTDEEKIDDRTKLVQRDDRKGEMTRPISCLFSYLFVKCAFFFIIIEFLLNFVL